MSEALIPRIAYELKLPLKGVRAVVELLDSGSTVPFIARYRKEATGSLDEVAITNIRDRLNQLRELEKRREAILASLKEMGKLTDELKEKILAAQTLAQLEDIYLPYRPKRRTRATIAKEKGLEPLAQLIWRQDPTVDPFKEAEAFINEEKKVGSIEEALAGARDIMAEWVNEDSEARGMMREFYMQKGVFRSKVIKGKEQEGANYKDYFDWTDQIKTAPSHRILAVRRAEREKIVSLRIVVPEDEAVAMLTERIVKNDSPSGQQVAMAVEDAFKRLLSFSMETEMRALTKERADDEAIVIFAKNLRELLMAPPLGPHTVMAIDPGYRTGCKVAVLSPHGKLLEYDTIYPSGDEAQKQHSRAVLRQLCAKHRVEFIAIGNGTGSRETEQFVRTAGLPDDIRIMIVSESGASIYSASEAAREEFPDLDVTVRGAISIGRRLQDPLAELVKIDPKSIGVGQYQYDVDQGKLKRALDDVVISCVNLVGVDLNTASKQLLTYISGLGPTRAQAIVDYRLKHGPFKNRDELYNVPRLGAKAIEQAAGFLRIRNGTNILDSTAVHPESYPIVYKMASDLNVTVADLIRRPQLREKIRLERYVTETVGLPTLEDIYQELCKPGRDPRDKFEFFEYREDVHTIEDLKPGMRLPGVVTNITKFGAFIDVGVHLDGLLHISQISDGYVKEVSDVLKVHQKVEVTVLSVDPERKRIALTMRKNPPLPSLPHETPAA